MTRNGKMERLAQFIAQHSGEDPDRLALQKERWPDIDVAAAAGTLVSRRKLAGKAPLWATTDGLVMPRTLSAEQCSGEAAARHKASVISRVWSRYGDSGRKPRIADLTGGLGVDCLEFSRIAEAVLYNDMNPVLAEAAGHNFNVLGAEGIEVSCIEAGTQTLKDCAAPEDAEADGRPETAAGALSRRLGQFRPDVIFLDPARRDGCGRKVFLLEDCSPDVLALKGRLLETAGIVAVKLSPMADISMVIDRLGRECAEVQIIESGGECKELLAILLRGNSTGDCRCSVQVLGKDGTDVQAFQFSRGEESSCTATEFAGAEDIVPGAELFEPGKALMKAGCFRLLGTRLGAFLLGQDTHYYIIGERTMSNPAEDGSQAETAGNGGSVGFAGLGKTFRILDAAVMSGKSMKDFGKRHPEAEVTARNVKMTSEELRKRLGTKPSDRFHIFALHVDKAECNMLIFCEKA